jgi:hypothetical protein
MKDSSTKYISIKDEMLMYVGDHWKDSEAGKLRLFHSINIIYITRQLKIESSCVLTVFSDLLQW